PTSKRSSVPRGRSSRTPSSPPSTRWWTCEGMGDGRLAIGGRITNRLSPIARRSADAAAGLDAEALAGPDRGGAEVVPVHDLADGDAVAPRDRRQVLPAADAVRRRARAGGGRAAACTRGAGVDAEALAGPDRGGAEVVRVDDLVDRHA